MCAGGAAGTAARYLIALSTRPPFGTLIVNLLGSFLIAFIMESSAGTEWAIVLTTGVMGGFTTYSAFNYDTTTYLRVGHWSMAAMNVGVTLLGCIVAGFAGFAAARLLSFRA